MLAQEEEAAELLKELTGPVRAAVYELSVYQPIRARGPDPDPVQLAEAVEQASRHLTAASDARVNQGQLRQPELWQSSLPLGRDVARLTRKYVTRHVGDSLPLVGTRCVSPTGIPFAFTEPGRTVELLNPFETAHVGGIERATLERAQHPPTTREPQGSAPIEPALEQRERCRVEPHEPLAVALAVANVQHPARRVDVARLERECLGDAKAAAVQDRNKGTVSNPGRRPRRAGAQERP
jgi:hypothetical protein